MSGDTELEKDLAAHAADIQTESERIMANIRPMLHAKDAALTVAGKTLFPVGSHWRVVREGARLEGIQSWGERSFAGFSQRLEIGDELIVDDWRKGMAGKFEECNVRIAAGGQAKPTPDNLLWCQVWPMASLWRPWPLAGFLERIES